MCGSAGQATEKLSRTKNLLRSLVDSDGKHEQGTPLKTLSRKLLSRPVAFVMTRCVEF